MNKIDDAGELIPYAKKHIAKEYGKKSQEVFSLKDVWPEPNWCEERNAGRSVEVLAHLYMLYEGFPKSPKASRSGLSNADWSEAYQKSIIILKEIFAEAKTVEDARSINDQLAKKLGFTLKTIPKLPNIQAAIFWAVGRGNSKLKAPGNFTARQVVFAEWLPKLGWPDSDGAIKCGLFPLELEDGTFRIARVKGNGFEWERDPILESEQDAINAVMGRIKTEIGNKTIVNRQDAGIMERKGPDWRDGQDITAENLMAEFGLRGIQFGNALPQSQRQELLNSAFDALADLADVIGMQRRWIGLGGIALAFAARGQGKAMAHYEPGLRAINLTREKGAGSLAHEWAHGLDHRLAKKMTVYATYYSTSLDSFHKTDLSERQYDIAKAIKNIVMFIKNKDKTSDYFIQSRKISWQRGTGNYWHQTEEMFARGFEAYLQDALLKKGRTNPWLVHGTLVTDYLGDDESMLCPYPTKIERIKLWGHYYELMSLLAQN